MSTITEINIQGVEENIYHSYGDMDARVYEHLQAEIARSKIGQHLFDAGKPVIGIDIETTGTSFREDTICIVQVSVQHFFTNIIYLDMRDPILLAEILETDAIVKVFHTAKHDIAFLMWRMSRFREKFFPASIACVQVAASIFYRDRAHPFTPNFPLAQLVAYHFNEDLDKSIRTSNWCGELTQEQIEYAVKDSYFLTPLFYRLLDRMTQLQIAEYECACSWLVWSVWYEVEGYRNPLVYYK